MKYATAFDIARTAADLRREQGWAFREGVERAAALAATEAQTNREVAETMVRTLDNYRDRSPLWDGAIG